MFCSDKSEKLHSCPCHLQWIMFISVTNTGGIKCAILT